MLSRAREGPLASSGLGLKLCVTATLTPSEGAGMDGTVHHGLVPEAVQVGPGDKGACSPKPETHWPSSGRQTFCPLGRPTAEQVLRVMPALTQSGKYEVQGTAQLPFTQ